MKSDWHNWCDGVFEQMHKLEEAGVIIVLPVLNEAENIVPLLEGIHRELSNIPYTVCLIDDGSKDGTVEKIYQLMSSGKHHLHLIQRQKTWYGSQRGSALQIGMEWGLHHTLHEIFVEMDGDLS
ncbi:MAG TPA: glycosyltransferase, partial [Microcoleaceae cyanobacterium]